MLIEYLFTYPRRVDQLLHPHHPYKKDLPYRPIPLLVFSLGNRDTNSPGNAPWYKHVAASRALP